MINRIRRLFSKKNSRPAGHRRKERAASFESPAIAQVEVTTRCNFKCRMCPRTHFSGEKNLDFPWPVFESFSGFFPRLRLVYLQGWGEPLMHPHFFDMAARVRATACQVGCTTNGALLDDNAIDEIVRLPMQYITISLAGADAGIHDAIRAGSDFDALLGKVADLVAAKKRAGSQHPQVHLSFLMTRESAGGVAEMVKKAHEIGVDRLIAPNLDNPVSKSADGRRIFGFEEPETPFQNALDEAQITANNLNFRLSVWPLKLSEDIVICELNPTTQFFVNVHGDVAPCTYASVTGRSDFCRYFLGKEIPVSPLLFGSLANQDMEAIWNEENYRRFRMRYHNRIQAFKSVNLNRSNISSIFGLKDYLHNIDRALAQNPVPDFCRTCYKAYGA